MSNTSIVHIQTIHYVQNCEFSLITQQIWEDIHSLLNQVINGLGCTIGKTSICSHVN
eukprot:07972.XXX_187733_187903_1 [CDS] Oithona nana genome sequencing.